MTHSRKKFGSAADATAAQQQMSLVSKGQRATDQPAGVAVATVGQQMGYFQDISAATGADEMKGP